MLLSIGTITLSLATMITYISIGIAVEYLKISNPNAFILTNLGQTLWSCLGFLLEFLIFQALMFDLQKWLMFIVATNAAKETRNFELLFQIKSN